jgi:hypothetical protein
MWIGWNAILPIDSDSVAAPRLLLPNDIELWR